MMFNCNLTGLNHLAVLENMNGDNEGETLAFQKTTKMPSSKVFIPKLLHLSFSRANSRELVSLAAFKGETLCVSVCERQEEL